MKKVLFIDAYNMIHRCRFNWGGGMADGEYKIVYNFTRLIKATAEEYNADDIYFVVDGKPKKRIEKFAEYKANRKKELVDPEEIAYWESFHRQKRIILNMVKEKYPITYVYHSDNEADDVIYHLCQTKLNPEDEGIIISSDSDYIQIINEYDNVKLYNPVARKWRNKTEYDYVSWKAMVGDRSDNIPGVPRIGKVTAEKILKNGELSDRLKDQNFRDNYQIGYDLIKLFDLSDIADEIEMTKAEFDLDSLTEDFKQMEFNSVLDETYYPVFKSVFERLA